MMDELDAPIPPPPAPFVGPFRVGEWLVEPPRNRIGKGGALRKLEPRVMRLLATLAASAGRPLSRSALLDAVWPDVTVNEEALSRGISQLRRALDDDSRKPAYIETVHKSGYCLIAPVSAAQETVRATSRFRAGRRAAVIALLLLAAAAAALVFLAIRPRAPEALAELVATPLTSDPGREIDPAISRDGTRLAYLASHASGYDLFWRRIGDSRAARLTRGGRAVGHPVWSPDGGRIAYVGSNADGSGAALLVVDVATGATEKLLDLPGWSFGLDWSADGRTLAYSRRAPGSPSRIVLLDLATRASRTLPPPSAGDNVKPVFAPAGDRIAFLADAGMDQQRIFIAPVDGAAAATVLGSAPQQIRGLDWESGGALIYSARSNGRFSLWRAATSEGQRQALPAGQSELFNPSVSAGGRLVAEAVERDSDIWRMPTGGGTATPFIRSTFDEYDPAFLASGRRIAFVSERSGTPELWSSGAGGEGAAPLTTIGGAEIGRPAWSRDGRRIAFFARRDGYAATHVAAVDRRTTTAVRGARGVHHVPLGWAAATDELFVLSGSDGAWLIDRIDLGSSRSSRLSPAPVRAADMDADGGSIFAIDADGTQAMRLFLDGRPPERTPLPAGLRGATDLRVAAGTLFFMTPVPGGVAVSRWMLSRDAPVTPLGDIPANGPVAISPDGAWILFGWDRESSNDIVMIELRPR
jgi:Tol biopolymer transport system component/DNA-binding winged helix-turn-helix (wHTH) protein